jgi:hypothetical protein
MFKKIAIALGIIIGTLAAVYFCLLIYIGQNLNLPNTTDQELLETLFPLDFPGYSRVEIVSSEGEGPRRIPRTIEIVVLMESYPKRIACEGEVFFAMGDPMALNVRWQTIQCAGQQRYMDLAKVALESGFNYSECHKEKITLLLARWVESGLMNLDQVIFPAVNESVASMIENPNLLVLQPALDGGLFDTSEVIVRDDISVAGEATQYQSIVLRCDGRLELFRVDPGFIHSYTEIPVGDYLLPYTLVPFVPAIEK